MKKTLKTLTAFAAAATFFSGCTEGLNDLLGMSPEDMDEILIYNETDVRLCEGRVPAHSNSVIEYSSSEKTCEDFDRTPGEHCQIYYHSTNNTGDTTCVIGYDK
jgi:hypothetical protein